MLQEAGKRAGAERHGALLITVADLVEQGLREGSDVFAALAQGRNGEADGAEAESKVGQKQALASHLAQRDLRGSKHHGAAGRAVLHGLENAE